MTQPVPNCLRAIVTCIYSDGTSIVVDIKDPEMVKTEWVRDIADEDEVYAYYTHARSVTKFNLEAKISKETPAIISSYPVPK